MDNIIINLDDSLRLGGDPLPNIASQSDIISQSDAIVGPQGPAGPAGPAGKDGEAATITVGSTTTGAAGTNAVVQNSGTSSAAILDFTIPRGDKGETGATGATGATGPAGADGEAATITVGSVTTVSSEYPATVTNSGTSSAAVLDFQIPQGIQGATGPAGADGRDGTDGRDGVDGQAATITVGTTTTLPAGSSATVTNSGTSSAAVFNFGIPKGADGSDAPVPNDGTLTIQKNGTTVQTFTANQATNVTANITVPTQFSDLSGTIGTSQISNSAVTNAKIDWNDLFSNSDVYHVGSGGTEQIVGKWNDGRSLYRTVIWIGLGENVETVIDMTSYNIYEIVQFFEVMKTTDGSYFPAYYYANGDDWARWYYGGGDKKIHAISRWGSRGMILTLYYTKVS